MAKHFIFRFFLIALSALLPLPAAALVKAVYDVVPLPHDIEMKGGAPFLLDGNTVITFTDNDSLLHRNATMLTEYIKDVTGLYIPSAPKSSLKSKPGQKMITLSAGLASENPEAYQIKVTSDKIEIEGASPAGNFYGIQTLRKSIPADNTGASVEFPQAVISDFPQFGYRGAHLDVARHFFPADSVKTYIDMMSLHNMNRLHWHLTDDQGWRLPLKKHPELITKGSVRRGTCIGKDFSSCDSIPYGGFYTPAEVQDIIAYATERYITVIPEIDLPGHMLAALTAHPDLGCTGGPYELWTIWGVSDDVLCAGNEGVYTLLKEVLTEVADIFPSEYIHIGGDECPKVRWKNCRKCQAKIAELGLKDDEHFSKEDKLQSHVMSFASDILAAKGKKIIGWDEILEGDLPENAVVMSWRGAQGGQKAAGMGHDAIMTPYTHYYLDYYQSDDTGNEPLAIGGYIPLSKAYSFEPFEGISPENRHHILGIQANLWTEYIHTFSHAQYMVLPRWAALAEVQWSDPSSRDFDAFKSRLARLRGHYDLNGYTCSQRLE